MIFYGKNLSLFEFVCSTFNKVEANPEIEIATSFGCCCRNFEESFEGV